MNMGLPFVICVPPQHMVRARRPQRRNFRLFTAAREGRNGMSKAASRVKQFDLQQWVNPYVSLI
ncbi:hypothetical protein V6767_08655 [Martelella sp. FLE1502]